MRFKDLVARLRAVVTEGIGIVRASFGLTTREREGALLLAALFAIGLAVRGLRWLLGM